MIFNLRLGVAARNHWGWMADLASSGLPDRLGQRFGGDEHGNDQLAVSVADDWSVTNVLLAGSNA